MFKHILLAVVSCFHLSICHLQMTILTLTNLNWFCVWHDLEVELEIWRKIWQQSRGMWQKEGMVL